MTPEEARARALKMEMGELAALIDTDDPLWVALFPEERLTIWSWEERRRRRIEKALLGESK
jgi:hypothetical protein